MDFTTLWVHAFVICNYIGDADNYHMDFILENDRRIVVNYNAKRARKDSHDRETAITKLQKKLQRSKDPSSLISNYGYKKYLVIEGEAKIKIDQAKLAKEASWDGLHGIITNIKDMSSEAAMSHYRGLWQVEESFRITKHDLKVRPIYHWTPSRIKAHLCIAFMSFTCVRQLEYRVQLQYKKMSPEAIRKELLHSQISILKNKRTQERYCVPSKVSQDSKKIYHLMGIKHSTVPFKLEKIASRKVS